MPQEGDNAIGNGPPRPEHTEGLAGAGGCCGHPRAKESPHLPGTLRAPGPPFSLPLPQSHAPRDLRSPARSSLASTPSSQDVLTINPTLELRVGTIRLLQNLELMGKSQNSFFN